MARKESKQEGKASQVTQAGPPAGAPPSTPRLMVLGEVDPGGLLRVREKSAGAGYDLQIVAVRQDRRR